MDCYSTRSEPAEPASPVGPGNFRVFELSRLGEARIPARPLGLRGELYVYVMVKQGITTLDAARRVKRILGASSVAFHGLKDARAVAGQFVAVAGPSRFTPYYRSEDLELVLVGMASRAEFAGSLVGNCFEIDLAGLSKDLDRALEAVSEISSNLFLPNYYSYQRFGVSRPVTHVVGLGVLCGEPERALEALVTGDPRPRAAGREVLERCGEILSRSPGWMWLERLACREYLSKRDPGKALKRIPRRYLDLFVSAAGSYLFNLYLSSRWREQGLGPSPRGDEVVVRLAISGARVPGLRTRVTRLLSQDRIPGLRERLSGLGIGSCRPSADRILIRPLLSKPEGLAVRGGSLAFCLDRGGYATNLLREVFKERVERLYARGSQSLDGGPGGEPQGQEGQGPRPGALSF